MTGKGNGMGQREYWESLSRSFDRRFIDKARRDFDPRNRPQAHRSRENGIKNTGNATTVREGAHMRPEKGGIMTFETVTRYILRCDDCGRRYRKAYDPVGRPTLGTMKQRLLWEARSDDWQITDTRQTCPNHWHAGCALCGRTADMTLYRLVQAGWADADPHPMPPSKCGDGRHWLAYAKRLACPECSLRFDLMDWLADRILAADDNPRAWDLSRAAARMLDAYKTEGADPDLTARVLEAVTVMTPERRRLIDMAAADGDRSTPPHCRPAHSRGGIEGKES